MARVKDGRRKSVLPAKRPAGRASITRRQSIHHALARIESATDNLTEEQVRTLAPVKSELLALLEENDSDLDAEGEDDWEYTITGLPPASGLAAGSASNSGATVTETVIKMNSQNNALEGVVGKIGNSSSRHDSCSPARKRPRLSASPGNPPVNPASVGSAPARSPVPPLTSLNNSIDANMHQDNAPLATHKHWFDDDLSDLSDSEGFIERPMDTKTSTHPRKPADSSNRTKTSHAKTNRLPLLVKRKTQPNAWTRAEDRLLVYCIISNGVTSIDWDDVTTAFGYTLGCEQLQNRWNAVLQSFARTLPSSSSNADSGTYERETARLISVILNHSLRDHRAHIRKYADSKQNVLHRSADACRCRWSLLTKLGLLDVIRHREGDQTLEHGVSDIEGDGLAIQVKMEMIQDDIEHNPTATMLDRDEHAKEEEEDVKPNITRSAARWTAAETTALLNAVVKTATIDWSVVHAQLATDQPFGRTVPAVKRRWAAVKNQLTLNN